MQPEKSVVCVLNCVVGSKDKVGKQEGQDMLVAIVIGDIVDVCSDIRRGVNSN